MGNFPVIFLILVLSAWMAHRCVFVFLEISFGQGGFGFYRLSEVPDRQSAFSSVLGTGLCGRTALGFITWNKKDEKMGFSGRIKCRCVT